MSTLTPVGQLLKYIDLYCQLDHEYENHHPERKIGRALAELLQDLQLLKTHMQGLTNHLSQQDDKQTLDDYIFKINQLSYKINEQLPALTPDAPTYRMRQ